MFQSRDQVRQVYLDVWQKMQQQSLLEPMEAMIAEIIEWHPEYHDLLDDAELARQQEFTPEQGRTNPFLHMGMHLALREQSANDRPLGIRAISQKLVAARGPHDADHAMMECLAESLWEAQRNNRPPDEAAYLECLKKL